MPIVLEAVSEEDYEAWVKGMQTAEVISDKSKKEAVAITPTKKGKLIEPQS